MGALGRHGPAAGGHPGAAPPGLPGPRLERLGGLARGGGGGPKPAERTAPTPPAGETRAPTAAAPGAAWADGGAGGRLSQIASGVGHHLWAAAARAWREVEEIWADAQRLQHSGPR